MPLPKMDPRIKQLWIKALRSGAYEQITGQLRDATIGRCCLGVLCDIAVAENVVETAVSPKGHDGTGAAIHGYTNPGVDEDDDPFDDREEVATGMLPAAVYRWAGLNGQDPVIMIDSDPEFNRQITASTANDDESMSFSEIADVIERNL